MIEKIVESIEISQTLKQISCMPNLAGVSEVIQTIPRYDPSWKHSIVYSVCLSRIESSLESLTVSPCEPVFSIIISSQRSHSL